MKTDTYSIYAIYNTINGKMYIGRTNDPSHRWSRHKCTAKAGRSRGGQRFSVVHAAISKYTPEAFVFRVIENGLNFLDANGREVEWIATLKTMGFVLYNMTDGGDGASSGPSHPYYGRKIPREEHPWTGRKHSEESKHLMSELAKQRPPPRKGFSVTDETKRKISKSLKDKPSFVPPENRSRIGNPKLTIENVREVRRLFAVGDITKAALGRMFNVSKTQISNIVSGRSWAGEESPCFSV